jgi:hypothetical protein
VANVCGSSYSGGRDGRITVPDQPGQKGSKISSQSISQAWWCMPVIPSTQEAIGRRLCLRLASHKKMKPYLKNN